MSLLALSLDLPDLLVGAVRARGVTCGPSPEPLLAALRDAAHAVADAGEYPDPVTKKAVRGVLRTRGYKPAGRGKPASEYLCGVARKGEFPEINTLVDINNLVSLQSALPISILDRGLFEESPTLRFADEGERYVFNSVGHEIDLKGLITVCDGDTPRGTPIKDSMATKVSETTTDTLVIVYGTRAVLDAPAMEALARRLADLLAEHAGASDTAIEVLAGA
jgi:DNA/RNA-binding domain of Phe-tRNA-synthetase-like protein